MRYNGFHTVLGNLQNTLLAEVHTIVVCAAAIIIDDGINSGLNRHI
jgi:hypothetical protein